MHLIDRMLAIYLDQHPFLPKKLYGVRGVLVVLGDATIYLVRCIVGAAFDPAAVGDAPLNLRIGDIEEYGLVGPLEPGGSLVERLRLVEPAARALKDNGVIMTKS